MKVPKTQLQGFERGQEAIPPREKNLKFEILGLLEML